MFPPKLLSRVCLCVLGVALAMGSTPSLASTPKVSCIARWPLVSSLCWYDPEHCDLDARVSDSGNLFILNTNLAELSVVCPDNRCLLQYKPSLIRPSLSFPSDLDFTPFNDKTVYFMGALDPFARYDLDTDSVVHLETNPKIMPFRCGNNPFLDPPKRHNLGRLGDSNLLLVCPFPHISFRDPSGLDGFIWPIYVVDVSTLSATLIDQKPRVLGNDFNSPWGPMLAGEDGNIYQPGSPILRWNFQTSVWVEVIIANPVFTPGAGMLEAIDKKSALYFNYFSADTTRLDRWAKYAQDGTLQWVITNDDMQIKTQWMTLLRVMDDGKLVFWSENGDNKTSQYQAYECTVNDGE